jgi:3-oxoacyl-[acyl-carrier-protein] synthase-3
MVASPQPKVADLGSSPTTRRRACILGTGSAVPAHCFRNTDFPASLQTSDEWIYSRTGIRERRYADTNETSATLGVLASRRALENAGVQPSEIDLIVCATVTPETMVPANACRIQGGLDCRTSIGAFDLNGACTGFVQGVVVAHQFLASGAAQRVLVVGTELLSRAIDFSDRTSCILFGDGAGAVLLGATEEPGQGLLWSRLYSDGKNGHLIWMPAATTYALPPLTQGPAPVGNPYLRLNGREVFKFAVRCLINLVQEAVSSVPLPPGERVFLVPHQVNQRILDAALPELPIPRERIIVNLEHHGNTSAASVPIALDEAVRKGTIQRGDHVVLAAFGGGMTWGAALMRL